MLIRIDTHSMNVFDGLPRAIANEGELLEAAVRLEFLEKVGFWDTSVEAL